MTVAGLDVDNKVKAAIELVLRKRMGRYGFKYARVTAGVDFDDDPVLFVEAEYDLVNAPLDAEVTAGLVTELRDALYALGETRFPHVRHNFDDRQAVASSKKSKRA